MTARTPEQWADQMLDRPLALGDDYGNLLISLGIKGPQHRLPDERYDANEADSPFLTTAVGPGEQTQPAAKTTTTAQQPSPQRADKAAGSASSPFPCPPHLHPYHLPPSPHISLPPPLTQPCPSPQPNPDQLTPHSPQTRLHHLPRAQNPLRPRRRRGPVLAVPARRAGGLSAALAEGEGVFAAAAPGARGGKREGG